MQPLSCEHPKERTNQPTKNMKTLIPKTLVTLTLLALSLTAQAGQNPDESTTAANTWYGYQALFNQHAPGVSNSNNTAYGYQALYSCLDGVRNVAAGPAAALSLTTGDSNIAIGSGSLTNSVAVNFNTAVGRRALFRVQSDQNTALGFFAGSNANDGSVNNIYIGNVGPVPIGPESNTIRIGTQIPTTATIGNPPIESHPMPAHTDTYIAGIFGSATSLGIPVYVDADGKLGTTPSSQRFKDEIKPMENASEAILSLRPVTFRYKKEIDPKKVPQFGLVAEEVAKVNPDLVARDSKGEIYSVRYDAVNAMLLNEFLKAHQRIEKQDKRIDELTAQLKQQAALIQKVSDRVELGRPSPQVVDNR